MRNILIWLLGVVIFLAVTFPIWYLPVSILVYSILKKDYGYDIPESAYSLTIPSKKMSDFYLETEKGFIDKNGYTPKNMKNVIAIYIGFGGYLLGVGGVSISKMRLYRRVPIQDIKEIKISPLGRENKEIEDILSEISNGVSGSVSIITDKKTYKFKNLLDTMNSSTEYSFYMELEKKLENGEITKEEEAYEFSEMRHNNSCLHALSDCIDYPNVDDIFPSEKEDETKITKDSSVESKDSNTIDDSLETNIIDNNLSKEEVKVHLEGTKCRNCGTVLRIGSLFCHECGQSVNGSWLCPNCGCELPNGSKYCLSCGSLVGPDVYKKVDINNPRKIANISEELGNDNYDS